MYMTPIWSRGFYIWREKKKMPGSNCKTKYYKDNRHVLVKEKKITKKKVRKEGRQEENRRMPVTRLDFTRGLLDFFWF